jgi:hypothetical protein
VRQPVPETSLLVGLIAKYCLCVAAMWWKCVMKKNYLLMK